MVKGFSLQPKLSSYILILTSETTMDFCLFEKLIPQELFC